MAVPRIKRELLDALGGLPEKDLRRVLAFVRDLAPETPAGKPGRNLLRHVGSLPEAEVDRIAAAIEEGCERVNPDAW